MRLPLAALLALALSAAAELAVVRLENTAVNGVFEPGVIRASLLSRHIVVRRLVQDLHHLGTDVGCLHETGGLHTIPPTAKLSFWQMFHAANTTQYLYRCPYCRQMRMAGPALPEELYPTAIDLNRALPSLALSGVQKMIAESAGVILLGFLADAPCFRDKLPEWIGTGSWRMDQKKRALPCNRMRDFDFSQVQNDTVVFWNSVPRTDDEREKCAHVAGYPFGWFATRTAAMMLEVFLRQLFGVSAPRTTCPNHCSIPLANYYIVRKPYALGLAQLHVLAVAWLLDNFPMNCRDEVWRVPHPDFYTHTRCWSYFLEDVSILYFCHVMSKVAIGSCDVDDFYPPFGQPGSGFSLAGIDAAYQALLQNSGIGQTAP